MHYLVCDIFLCHVVAFSKQAYSEIIPISGFVLKYEGSRNSAILRSPVIPESKPYCIQFYFKPLDVLQSINDLIIEVNGAMYDG